MEKRIIKIPVEKNRDMRIVFLISVLVDNRVIKFNEGSDCMNKFRNNEDLIFIVPPESDLPRLLEMLSSENIKYECDFG